VNADPGSDADLDQLADCLVAAFHGGILGTQAARDITPLRDALYGAIARVESHIPEAKIAAAVKLNTERDILRAAAKYFAGETNW
jgi:hypothetical protein